MHSIMNIDSNSKIMQWDKYHLYQQSYYTM